MIRRILNPAGVHQPARWICEALSLFDTTKTPTATDLQPASGRCSRCTVARLNAIESFVTQQADVSRRYAFQLSQLGETGQAQLNRERADLFVQLSSQIAVLRSKRFR